MPIIHYPPRIFALGVIICAVIFAKPLVLRHPARSLVEYSPGYLADHWCNKGHILLCLQGQLNRELEGSRTVTSTAGMRYQVAANAEAHRSPTTTGAKLFIVG
jgi:hypothetical protein